MQISRWKITIGLIIVIYLLTAPFTVGAETIPLDETSLYPDGNAASLYTSSDGNILVVDDLTELWVINPLNGNYQDYFPFGGDNLADITFETDQLIWWSDNATNFGSFNLLNNDYKFWTIDIQDYDDQPFNLGPAHYFANKLWLASWYGETYGIFSFDDPNICLYGYVNGLFAADLVDLNGMLWMLDWSSDSLFSMDPSNGSLVKYPLGRSIHEKANMAVGDNVIWWTEDQDNGAIASFEPSTKTMTTYSLPIGTHPRNLALKEGKVWYTDSTGRFGRLDPNLASHSSVTLIEQVVATSITPGCLVVDPPYEDVLSPSTGTFSWTQTSGEKTEPIPGIQQFSMPAGSTPYGIAGTPDFIWISDPGRNNKLVRMFLPPPQAYIIVNKVVVNDHGGTAEPDDFNLTLGGQPVSSGIVIAVEPGTYQADETQIPGYSFTGFSGDCDSSGNVTVVDGETKTCTLTNDDVAPQLTVIKHVINDHGGAAQASDFTMNVTGTDVSQFTFPGSEAGTTVTLDAGVYNVSEINLAGYSSTYSADCSGSIGIGQSKICTFTNDDIAPQLTVIKHVINEDGGGALASDFTMNVTGVDVSPSSFPGSETGTNVTLDAGTYTVSETGLPGYTASYSVDCSGVIGIGENKVCTITNDDQPAYITLVKVVVNDDSGTALPDDFVLLLDSWQLSTGIPIRVDPGTYLAGEIQLPGYMLVGLSGDCDIYGNITIDLGQSKTCTLTNDDMGEDLTRIFLPVIIK